MLSISSTDRREKRPRVKKRAHDPHIHPSPPHITLSLSRVRFFLFFWLNTRVGPASRPTEVAGGHVPTWSWSWSVNWRGKDARKCIWRLTRGRRGSALGTPWLPRRRPRGGRPPKHPPALPILAASTSRTSPRSSCSASCSTSPPRTLLVAPECAVPSA